MRTLSWTSHCTVDGREADGVDLGDVIDLDALGRMSRIELIAYARSFEVANPEQLTRAELIDELIRTTERDADLRRTARGWFGVARDLLANIVEQGLHLPDAAQRIRGGSVPPPPNAPIATVTLADIYASQGHTRRALRMLAEVLALEPEHEAARRLHEQLLAVPQNSRESPENSHESPEPVVPRPSPLPMNLMTPGLMMPGPTLEPEAETPGHEPAYDPLAARSNAEGAHPVQSEAPLWSEVDGVDVDEVVGPGEMVEPDDLVGPDDEVVEPNDLVEPNDVPAADEPDANIVVTRDQVVVSWGVLSSTRARAAAVQPGGRLVLRVVMVCPGRREPLRVVREVALESSLGSTQVESPEGLVATVAAVGWRSEAGFTPLFVARG